VRLSSVLVLNFFLNRGGTSLSINGTVAFNIFPWLMYYPNVLNEMTKIEGLLKVKN